MNETFLDWLARNLGIGKLNRSLIKNTSPLYSDSESPQQFRLREYTKVDRIPYMQAEVPGTLDRGLLFFPNVGYNVWFGNEFPLLLYPLLRERYKLKKIA